MNHQPDRNTWPELLYRFIEHYKWESQHLRGSVDTFYDRIRRQEVPLNFLFNLLLSWSTPKTIFEILTEFGLADSGLDHEHLRLMYPSESKIAQPDVCIESENSRVFIEIKVGAPIKLEQVQRYLLLHAEMNDQKRPYLLFLTRDEFKKCWSPHQGAAAVDDIQSFLKQKTLDVAVPEQLARRSSNNAIAKLDAVKQGVTYGATTWNSVGGRIESIVSQWRATGST